MGKTRDEKKESSSLLKKFVDDSLAGEIIGDIALANAIKFVDLSVGFRPVVEHPALDYEFRIPEPVEVQHWRDGRYAIVTTGKRPDFEVVSEDVLKIMRARFLLLSNYYYKRLARRTLGHSDRQKVVDWYFDGAVAVLKCLA